MTVRGTLTLALIGALSLGFGVANAQEATSQFLPAAAYRHAPSPVADRTNPSTTATYMIQAGHYDKAIVSGGDGSAGR